jgi:hypothetical protein
MFGYVFVPSSHNGRPAVPTSLPPACSAYKPLSTFSFPPSRKPSYLVESVLAHQTDYCIWYLQVRFYPLGNRSGGGASVLQRKPKFCPQSSAMLNNAIRHNRSLTKIRVHSSCHGCRVLHYSSSGQLLGQTSNSWALLDQCYACRVRMCFEQAIGVLESQLLAELMTWRSRFVIAPCFPLL